MLLNPGFRSQAKGGLTSCKGTDTGAGQALCTPHDHIDALNHTVLDFALTVDETAVENTAAPATQDPAAPVVESPAPALQDSVPATQDPASAVGAPAPAPGVTLADFQVVKRIGIGVSSQVFLAKPLRLTGQYGRCPEGLEEDRPLALKQISKRWAKDEGYKHLDILRENELTQCLRGHPFCVEYVCSFQSDDFLYIVTEYLSGDNLGQYLREGNTLSGLSFLYLAAEIVSGLEFIHSRGIIHRDLKPDNIVFNGLGHAVIVDFGLAFLNTDEEEARQLRGTPVIRAPEMYGSSAKTEMIDWWALGVTLYLTLTGHNSFQDILFPQVDTEEQPQRKHKVLKSFQPVESCSPSTVWDFINGLLQENPRCRLGAGSGAEEVKQHPMFSSLLPTPVHWGELMTQQLCPPMPPHTWTHHLLLLEKSNSPQPG